MTSVSMMNMNSYNDHMKFIRYSTALRINRGSDDAAGLAISEKMRAQVRGDQAAIRNMGISQAMTRTAEGALSQSHSVLQRMRELSIQANNSLLTESDRSHLQREFDGLRDTLNAIGRDTQFNTKPLLDDSFSSQRTTTGADGSSVEMNITSALASHLGNQETGATIADIDLGNNPSEALATIDMAITQISNSRGNLGAFDNRLNHAINVTETKSLNTQASESRIRDADLAKNATELQKMQIMQQAYFMTQRLGIGMTGMNINLIR